MEKPAGADEPRTPLQWWRLVRDRGLKYAVQSLTIAQIYVVITTVAALLGWTIAILPRHNQSDDLVRCADATDYPKGRWMQSGRVIEYDHSYYPIGPPAV